MNDEVLIVQTAVGEYRRYFFEELHRLLGGHVEVLTGMESFSPSTELRLTMPMVRPDAINVFVGGRRLLWQRRTLLPGIRANVVVLEFNSRALSSWSILVVRWVLRRPSLLWGHARSRSRSTGGEAVRIFMRSLARGLIVYTESERTELQRISRRPVFAAPNALYPKAMMKATGQRPCNVIWTGRLVAEKKPLLALQGFRHALDQLPADSQLLMVGAGPQRRAIEELAAQLDLSDRVVVAGYISSPSQLGELYGSALMSLSTGYVGLSLVQSLAFGVPMLYAREEPHAPEIEAATDRNSCSFAKDDALSLAGMIVEIFEDQQLWSSRRDDIAETCRSHYSTEVMAESFAAAVQSVRA